MTDRELKRLSRRDLLEMMIELSKELQSTKEQLAKAKEALAKKEIVIREAGSIAEASLQLNGVFSAAQAACDQYLESVRALSQQQETLCRQAEEEGRAKAQKILEQAEEKRVKLERETEQRCSDMVRQAKAQQEMMVQLKAFWKANPACKKQFVEYVAQNRGQGYEA